MGYIHEVNVGRIANHFLKDDNYFKQVKSDDRTMQSILSKDKVFFKNGIPKDYVDLSVGLSGYNSFDEAYLQLIADLSRECADTVKLAIPEGDQTKSIYISGGFARNETFVRILATMFSGKKVYTSEMDNSTALGAALMVWGCHGN